jgi:hypothetical protein
MICYTDHGVERPHLVQRTLLYAFDHSNVCHEPLHGACANAHSGQGWPLLAAGMCLGISFDCSTYCGSNLMHNDSAAKGV